MNAAPHLCLAQFVSTIIMPILRLWSSCSTLNKYSDSFNLIVKRRILFNIFIVTINFVLNSIHHVIDYSFGDVLVNVENNLSLAHKLKNKMLFDWVLEYERHIGEKLIALKTRMDRIIFQPLCSMLGAHMVFNIVITKRGTPSLHFSSGFEFGIDLLPSTKCNTKMALQTNHLRSFRIVRCNNNHSIFVILILNIWW